MANVVAPDRNAGVDHGGHAAPSGQYGLDHVAYVRLDRSRIGRIKIFGDQ